MPLCPWDSPSKNTGVGCCALLQGVFLTLASNSHLLHLLHWQVDSSPLASVKQVKSKAILSLLPLFIEKQSWFCQTLT